MKIAPRNIQSFVAAPDKGLRVILLYGPNSGMIKEFGQMIASKFVDDVNDPFNVAHFTAASINEDPARFRDEASSLSLMGGQRLLWVREAADTITQYLKDICASDTSECIILVEAGELKPTSSLRKFCESDKKLAASIACYLEEERDIGGKIREICQHAGYSIEADAMRLLTESLAGDSAMLRSEVEKLILYKGLDSAYDGFNGEPLRRKIGEITLADVLACNPNMRDYSLDDLISMAATGNIQKAHTMTQKMLGEGLPPIAIMRAMLRHFRRLHITISKTREGQDMQSAMNDLRPKIFYKYEKDFALQARKWPLHALEATINKIVLDEAESKKGAMDGNTICLHLILNVARTANMFR